MGKIVTPGGGGGADTSIVTASAGDILLNKVIVDKDGNPLTGTMSNNGAVAPSALGAGGSYTIPEGYHDGNGKVTVQSLATLTSAGDATAAQILSGKKAYVDGSLLTGSMTDRGAQTKTFTPSGSTQTYTIPAGYHNGSGVVTCNAIPSGYVNIGGTWTVFNQGTFAANMGFVPYIYYARTSPSSTGIAITYSNMTYNGVSKKCVDMGWGGYFNDSTGDIVDYIAILSRAVDLSLFSSIEVGHYSSCGGETPITLMPRLYYGTTKSKFSYKNPVARPSHGFQTITYDVSNLSGLHYLGFMADACHRNVDKCGIYSIVFKR